MEAAIALGLVDDFAILGPAINEASTLAGISGSGVVNTGQWVSRYDRLRRAAENLLGNEMSDFSMIEEAGIRPLDLFNPRMEESIHAHFSDPDVIKAQMNSLQHARDSLRQLGAEHSASWDDFRQSLSQRMAEAEHQLRSVLPKVPEHEKKAIWDAIDPDGTMQPPHTIQPNGKTRKKRDQNPASNPDRPLHWQITQQSAPGALPARFAFYHPAGRVGEAAVKKFLVHFTQRPQEMLKGLQFAEHGDRLVVTVDDPAVLTSLQYQSMNGPGRG